MARQRRDDEHGPEVPHLPPPPAIPSTLRGSGATKKDDGQSTTAGLSEMGRAWGVAFEFMITIGAGGGGGWLFDHYQGTNPKGLMVGLGVGFAWAFYRIVRFMMKQDAAERAERERRKGS